MKIDLEDFDLQLRCLFLDKPYTIQDLMHVGSQQTRRDVVKLCQHTSMEKLLLAGRHHLQLLGVPPRDRRAF